ncbi:hypothetical protein ACOMHN_023827 [Nucella lapillus]
MITMLNEPIQHIFVTASTTIDTDAYTELTVDAPNCQLYFTTDGSRPVPFKRWMGDREVTFRYTAPFALKSGKRVVRAVAVSSDGLLESTVVSKTFMVLGNDYDTIDSDLYSDEDYMSHTSDVNWNSDVTGRSRDRSGTRRSWTPCKTWTQGRQSRSLSRPVSAEPNWIASTRRYPYLVDTVDGEDRTDQRPEVRLPEGPFNPINYSGTQINVWGAPPGSVWPAAPGMVTYPNTAAPLPRPTHTNTLQSGLLTRPMLEERAATDGSCTDDNRPLTVAEARRIIAQSEAEVSGSEQLQKNKKRSSLSSGNVSFSGLASSGKGLSSSYRSKKK